jgi:molecular chaperone HscB
MTATHFDLLGLPARYAIDGGELERNYRELLARVHPDRYASDAPAAQRESLARATLVNEAYRTLKGPVTRARYLLQLRGRDADAGATLPPDFLMQLVEWRETLDAAVGARQPEKLERLREEIAAAAAGLQRRLVLGLDEREDLRAAGEAAQQLAFLEKTMAAIDDACTALEE